MLGGKGHTDSRGPLDGCKSTHEKGAVRQPVLLAGIGSCSTWQL